MGALLIAAASALLVSAQSPAPSTPHVVTPQWLAEHLNDPQLVILHAGSQSEYDTIHVAGARFTPLSALSRDVTSGTRTLKLEMLEPEVLRQALERLGVSDNSQIVVMHGGEFITSATRILLTLEYAGLGAQARLLDGGLAAWVRARLPTTSVAPALTPGKLSPLKLAPTVASTDFVQRAAAAPGVVVVDARAPMFFTGAREGGPADLRRRGHIPGARSVPFNVVVNDRLEILKPAELLEVFRQAGVKPGDTIVTYCHIGQQATLVAFAARTIGIDARLYDGSFEEWVYRSLPVEVPPPVDRDDSR